MERLAPLATSTLANALDDLGCPDNVIGGIKGVATGFRFAGPAVTVKEKAGTYGAYSSGDFKVGAMIDAAVAGDVIVVRDGVLCGQAKGDRRAGGRRRRAGPG